MCSTALTGAVFLSFASANAQAQVVWQGDADDNFNNGSNWSSGAVPTGSGMIAVFNGAATTLTPNVSGNINLGGLEFASGAASHKLSIDAVLGIYTSIINNSGQMQTVDINSGSMQLGNGASIGQLTINNSDLLQFDGSSDASAARVFNNGMVALRGTFGAGTLSIGSLSGAGNLVFADTTGHLIELGALGSSDTISGDITSYEGLGDGGITKLGTGTLTLSGNSTYSGGTMISAGTVVAASNNALGTGPVMLGGGTLALTGAPTLGNAIDLSAPGTIRFEAGANGTLTGDVTTNGHMLTLNTIGSGTINGDIDGGTSAIMNSGLGGLTINGAISGTGAGVVAGSGTLVLNGVNTYGGGSGSTVIGNATLVVGNDQALSTSRLSTNSAGSVLSVNKDVALSNNVSLIGGFGLTIDTAGHALDMSGAFQTVGDPAPIAKTGAGTLTLSGDSTVGQFFVRNGMLHVDDGGLEQSDNGLQSFVGQGSGDDATLVIANGGTVTTNDKVHVGDAAGSRGEVFVRGDGSNLNVGDLTVGFAGDGALSVSEGAHLSTDAFMNVGGGNYFQLGNGLLSIDGAGSSGTIGGYLTIAGYGDGAAGQVTLSNGGSLDVADDIRMGLDNLSGSASLNIGAASTNAADAVAAGTLIGGGAVAFFTDTASLNFNHTGDAYVFDTPLTSTGAGAGFLHHYAGITNLTGDSSGFSGDTIVSGGTLAVNGRLGGTVDVASGGTLGGSGAVGGAGATTTIESGAILAPGNSVGTLDFGGDLVLDGGSILDFEFGAPGAIAPAGTSDRIAVDGNLTLGGTLNMIQSSDAADGLAGIGYYRLMTYGGTLTDNGLVVGDTSAFDASSGFELQMGGGNVDLLVAALGDDELQHWQGGAGTWNGTNTQWLNRDGGVPVAWAGNHAVFKNAPGGFNGGTVTVDGTQSFAGLQFVDDGYLLDGPGALETLAVGSEIRVLADSAEIATEITGTGGITKTQDGTLVLTGPNTYSGGTTIAQGALRMEHAQALGGGAVEVADGGALHLGHAATPNNAVTIAGSGNNGSGAIVGVGGNSSVIGPIALSDDATIGTMNSAILNVHAIATAGHTLTFSPNGTIFAGGPISGDGGITLDGSGLLLLRGNNTYTGVTTVENGTVRVGNGNAIADAGRVLVNAGGTFDVETSETIGSIGGAGNLSIFAGQTLTTTGDEDSILSGVISGQGELTKGGTGTLLLTGDSSGFAGSTTLNAGTLLVGDADGNGALGGSLDVLDDATLGGSGTVGSGAGSSVTVASGGTLEPGNSIGTLTVDGDLVLDAGSRFEVEVNPEGSDSDLVTVSGDATLNGGTVAHIGANGAYDLRSTYTILSADGTLSGTFDDVVSEFAFLAPELIYDHAGGTVDLELARNDTGFASPARTPNQIATAVGIDSIGLAAGHAVYDAIAQLPDDEDLIRASFDQLSGEIHASALSALIEDGRMIRNAANDRMRAAFDTAGASVTPVLAYGPGDTPMTVAADHAGPVFWSQGFGSWGSTDSDGNAAALDRNTGGLLFGTDGLVGDWRLGLLAGYSQSSFDADDRASSGSSNNYHLGVYGGTQWGDLGVRTGAAYTWHDVDTSRTVSIPGLSDSLDANYGAGTFQAFGELGYEFILDTGTRVEPFANLAHVSLSTDGFTEDGGAAALSVDEGTTNATFTTLGLRAEHRVALGALDATLTGMLGWRHAFGDVTPQSTHVFSVGDAFSIAGGPIARNSAVIEAGLDLDLTPDATFGLSYAAQIASDAHDHGVRANFGVRF